MRLTVIKKGEERHCCQIVGCRRTFKINPGEPADTEVMCAKHYRLGSAALRRRRSKIIRRMKTEPSRERYNRMLELTDRLWDRIRDQATERAMGI